MKIEKLKKLSVKKYVDLETGEKVEGTLVTPDSGVKMVDPKFVEFMRQLRELQERRNGEYRSRHHWVTCFRDSVLTLSNQLEITEAGALLKLVVYLHMESEGCLTHDGKPNQPLSEKDIMAILKRKDTRTRQILNKFVDLGILKKPERAETNVYYINERHHKMGRHPGSKRFIRVYTKRARRMLPSIGLSEAGMLYKMMPYMHYQSFYLCKNPNEDLRPPEGYSFRQTSFGHFHDKQTTRPIQYLQQKEIAEILGVHPRTVNRWTNNLLAAKLIYRDKNVNLAMRPDLFTRQGVGYDDYARRLVQKIDAQSSQNEPAVTFKLTVEKGYLIVRPISGEDLCTSKEQYWNVHIVTNFEIGTTFFPDIDFFDDSVRLYFGVPEDVPCRFVYEDGSPVNVDEFTIELTQS